MTYPYTPPYQPPYPPPRRGPSPWVWAAIVVGSLFVLVLLVAVAIPVVINLRGGPSGPGPQQVAPNLGTNALQVGKVRHGGAVDTTVLAVKKLPVRQDRPATQGAEWLGIRVNVCWHPDASPETPAIAWQNFVAVDAAGRGYLPVHAYDDFPAPEFPSVDPVQPGTCTSGWISTPVPVGGSEGIARVVLTDHGNAVAEWLR